MKVWTVTSYDVDDESLTSTWKFVYTNLSRAKSSVVEDIKEILGEEGINSGDAEIVWTEESHEGVTYWKGVVDGVMAYEIWPAELIEGY